MMKGTVLCYKSEEEWVDAACSQIIARLRSALAARRRATIMLAGGSTPTPVYRALVQSERIDWANVHFFWGDERPVPADHPESNFRMARETLLEPLGIPPDDPRVHRFRTEGTPAEAAAVYEQNLRRFFDVPRGESPVFDVVLLGMGSDGHTASLFPNTEALEEQEHLAMANPVPALSSARLTVTYPLLNAARAVLVLVRGEDKAERLREVLTGPQGRYPVQAVAPTQGDLVWVVDGPAAGQLPEELCERH
jgi:6-phosphogluconolactonase